MGKTLGESEALKVILEELKKQNRPFNHTLLHATLHGAVPKTKCQTYLDKLADSGKLVCKEFKKAKVYWASQEGLETVPVEELRALDKSIADKKERVKELTSNLSTLSSTLSTIEAAQPTKEILEDIEKVRAENEALEKKTTVLEEAASSTDPKELEKIKKQVDKTQSEWKSRKRKCLQILDQLGEGMDKKRDVLIEELELETDESAGVALPTAGPPPTKRRKLA